MSEKETSLIKELVMKYGLENAVKHGGSANEKSVMQKIMASHADLRKFAKLVLTEVEETIPKINALGSEKQKERLIKIAPELMEKKESGKRTHELPELENATKGKVVTRYAPEPNGEMHLGHAYTAYFAHQYAEKYDGTFILRFEDTNPKQEKIKYMDAHRIALNWLELIPTEERIVSNDMEIFYEKAQELIKNNYAYTCKCTVEKTRELRAEMKLCEHAHKKPKKTIDDWNKMVNGDYKEGSIVLRLRGDMNSKNAVMRDPAIFAIRKDMHCIHGDKYKVWPLYDFAVAIEDYICGITHVGRSSEFDSRIELQNKIRELLGLIPHPEIFHYARFNVIGSPASKRKIIPLIAEKKVEGWDDIRLVTIKGLQKRGIVPETIKQIILEVGMTTQPTNVDWSLISATNRKIIDKSSNRYFFVDEPVVLYVNNISKKQTSEAPLHPEMPERGKRKMSVGNLVLISKTDYEQISKNQEFRLKDLFNVRFVEKDVDLFKKKIDPIYYDEDLLKEIKIHAVVEFTDDKIKPGPKIQWLPAKYEEFIPIEVKIPDILFIDGEYNPNSLQIVSGFAEKSIKKQKVNDIVQFERYGFVRLDKKKKDKIYVNFSHK